MPHLLHVAQISFFIDPQRREPEQLLRDWPSLSDIAEAARGAGVRVSVIQACCRAKRLTRNGVEYNFLKPDEVAATIADSHELRELLRNLRADVFHVHGLGFPADVIALAHLAPDVPILVQDHANQPPRLWRRPLWRRALTMTSAVAFCSLAQAQPFRVAGLLQSRTSIFAIPESTSRFHPGDQEIARSETGIHGDPCLLWVGHLNDNKDPLTVLEGVSRAAALLPGLQLWCCFGVAPLLAEVQSKINNDPRLRGRVHLLGTVSHERIEQLMRAADLFVLGSHREGSGYSVIEALACGLPPIVTDIPSFRSLTGAGSVGGLWPCGDGQGLMAALMSMATQPRAQARAMARAHFDAELSFAAVGSKLAAVYAQLQVQRAIQTSSHTTRFAKNAGTVPPTRHLL